MATYKHDFVNTYDGLVGFGLDRATDEASLKVMLQQFSNDELLEALTPRLSEDEINSLVETVYTILRRRLEEGEYHRLFLLEHHSH